MFSKWRKGIVKTFGVRIAAWYFALFAAGALLILLLAGFLLSTSLARRDHDALLAALVRYTNAYLQGGVPVLDGLIAADRAAGNYEPVFVRVIGGGGTRLLSVPIEWTHFNFNRLTVPPLASSTFQRLSEASGQTLEVASARLLDGTVFQVGRTTSRRDIVTDRYREAGVLLFAVVLLVGLGGGWVLTRRALQPVRELRTTIMRILQTGRTSERVATQGTHDPLDEIGTLVNRMLDRIDGLVQGMRSTLDTVAHDLRTPLTRLRGNAEMALQSARSNDEYREALAGCVEEADRVRTMLDALMDLAEAETGTMRLRRDPVRLDEVLHDAVDLYEELSEDKGLTLSLRIDPDVSTITGDRARLRQVFANLLDNAIKYTPPPGRVSVTARQRDDGAEVTVEDTGPGIAPHDRERIWDRLYRADQSRSKRGLGIGLSLVRAIVEAHRGRAAVESDVGRGSRFIVWLPREWQRMSSKTVP
jgi:signal transduction histidine kinase